MTDTTGGLAEAAALIASAELAALQAILDKAKAFIADLNAIDAKLPFPPGYVSPAKRIAGGMASNLSFQVGSELPGLIKSYSPPEARPVPAPLVAPTA